MVELCYGCMTVLDQWFAGRQQYWLTCGKPLALPPVAFGAMLAPSLRGLQDRRGA
jgi:hypothetical protein